MNSYHLPILACVAMILAPFTMPLLAEEKHAIRVLPNSRVDHLLVNVVNFSSPKIRLWDESFSFGQYMFSFEIQSDGKKVRVSRTPTLFTRNKPMTTTILSHEYRLYAFDLTDGSWTWDNKITIEREAKIIVQFDSLGPLVPRSSLTKYSDPMMREYQVDEIFTRTREAVEIQPPRKPNKTDEKRGETGAEGDKNEKRGQMRNGVRQGSLRQDKHRQRGN
jgi:hypothetical protein